jgi:hypothetical protein
MARMSTGATGRVLCAKREYDGTTELRQVSRRRARLLERVEVRATGVGREDRGRAIGDRDCCRQRGTGRCRETWGVQRGASNTMLSVTIASTWAVYVGEIGALVPRQPVIEHLVETGKREPAPQYSKQQDCRPPSNECPRHEPYDIIRTTIRSSASWATAFQSTT